MTPISRAGNGGDFITDQTEKKIKKRRIKKIRSGCFPYLHLKLAVTQKKR